MTTSVTQAASPPSEARDDFDYGEIRGYFDRFATADERWRRRNAGYHGQIASLTRFLVPRGERVLEIGSGGGWLLDALEPAEGVGVDVSVGMVEAARKRFPHLRFVEGAGEDLDLGERFDYIVMSDLMPFVHDLLGLFERVAAHAHPRTRVIVSSYSTVWKPAIRVAERLGLKPRKPMRNWVAPEDVRNLLELSGFEVLTLSRRILFPKRVPGLDLLLNGFLANVWPLNQLCLTYWMVARPQPTPRGEAPSVSIVCPCRNEQGNVVPLIDRLPVMGSGTELIFVEGGSRDDTRGEIERNLRRRPDVDISLLGQPGTGKGDAVRTGFAAARNEVLMILDGDLSVRPEDLAKFYKAVVEGRAELVNGSRLVYDIEPGAMRFLNMLGNKVFSILFRALTGQQVKDTLCGTKVLHRDDYAEIARSRDYFGDFDPFGDFDLLFGATRLNLKIVDLPVRYQSRTYGTTNISRWRHGWLLLRMTVFAFWKFRVAPYRRRRG
jgi:SAM-dependent methyltransferase